MMMCLDVPQGSGNLALFHPRELLCGFIKQSVTGGVDSSRTDNSGGRHPKSQLLPGIWIIEVERLHRERSGGGGMARGRYAAYRMEVRTIDASNS